MYFYANFAGMKRVWTLLFFTGFYSELFAQNEVGPDGDKLIWILLIALIVLVLIFAFGKIKGRSGTLNFRSFFLVRRVRIELGKDRLYYPDYLRLKVKNTGNSDIDMDKPLLIFDNFWLKRKFKINGMNNHVFYPLYLEKKKTHSLEIDLNQFYRHDKRLKRFSKIRIVLNDVKKRRLGSKSIFIRKTLVRF